MPQPDAANGNTFSPPGAGGAGGPSGAEVTDETVDWLLEQWDGERWIVAVSGSGTASGITIASDGAPVMTMGGFTGMDPVPTADELAAYVAAGELRYVVVGGSGPGAGTLGGGGLPGAPDAQGDGQSLAVPNGLPGGGGDATVQVERTEWVNENCTPVTDVDMDGLYDCQP